MTDSNSRHLAALLERIGRLISTEAHAHGMLPVHWESLRYLGCANRFSQNAAALTAYLGLTKGTVSQTLGTLESKGLVKRTTHRADRRIKRLTLTAKGKSVLSRDPIEQTTRALASLDDGATQQLEAALQSILVARLTAHNRQPFGQCHDCRYFAKQHPEGNPHYCLLLEEKLDAIDANAICFEQQPALSN